MTPTTEQQPEQENKAPEPIEINVTQQYRIIFYALLEAAMRYREAYYRDDVELYHETLKQNNEKAYINASFSQRNKIDKWILDKVLTFEQEQVRLNNTIYDTIKKLESTLSQGGKVAFDNYSTAYALMCEELMKAKNTTEILTVCKLYNSGAMDETFQELKNSEYKQTLNDNYENKNDNTHTDSHAVNESNELQKENADISNISDSFGTDQSLEH